MPTHTYTSQDDDDDDDGRLEDDRRRACDRRPTDRGSPFDRFGLFRLAPTNCVYV